MFVNQQANCFAFAQSS